MYSYIHQCCSRQGIGFILQQQVSKVWWVLAHVGSLFLSSDESCYMFIELELLAVAWAVSKCNILLVGLHHFTIRPQPIDHHILNSHQLDEVKNPRLQNFCNELIAYNFVTVWCKGAASNVPDALSCYIPYGNSVQQTY